MIMKNATKKCLAGMAMLCLLSGCTVTAGKQGDSAEYELSSESLSSGTDGTGLQVTEIISDEQRKETANKRNENMQSETEERYKAILYGKEDIARIDYRGSDKSLNIENIKKVVSDEEWITAEVTKFTIIDLDGNGEDELVLWIQIEPSGDHAFEILFFEEEVYGFTLPARGLMNLKTDGTFETAGGINESEDCYGTGRIRQLSKSGYTIEDASDSGSQASKTDVGWYDLTPENVELIFEN